ncbi:MAG: LD-carboxypeptidase [Bryobacteraceae bacterium]|jgi:muramoyltetrapeptide carboxypeptidase
MTRRGFVSAVALSAGTLGPQSQGSSSGSLIKPPALREGDTVALITPATDVSDPGELATASAAINYLGLKPKLGRNVGKRLGYLGGTSEERLEDLHAAFRDPDVRGVFCIRGGYGCGQLLDRVDYGLIRSNPKVFVGYSDITALHLAIRKETGLVTFHGPVVLFHGSAAHFNEYTLRAYRKALFETGAIGRLSNPVPASPLANTHPIRTIKHGMAHGRLTGGNLTLVCSLMGTPYEIDTRDAIFFTEDVGEPPYRIDRMLTQLRLAGKLAGAAGVVFGECTSCGPGDYMPEFSSTLSLGEVLDQIVGRLSVPSFAGLLIGHTENQLTLPLGVLAALDADKGELVIEESAVS